MPKRKREDTERNLDKISDQAIRIKASRLKARFEQGVTQLTQALKLARGFDRQKMSRRIAQAGSDKVKLDRLKGEVEVLNGLQEGKVARRYLLKQCARTKRIAEAEGFIALFGGREKVLERLKSDAGKEGGGASGVVEGNVLGRLMKSGPVNEVVPGVMKGIREVLAVDKARPPGETKTEKTMNGQVERNGLEDDFEGFSDNSMHEVDDQHSPIVGPQNGTLQDNDSVSAESDDISLEAYNDRLAGSSDSESDHDDHDRTNNMLNDMEITSDEEEYVDTFDQQVDLSLPSASDDETSQPYSKPPATTQPKKSSTTSFLPTLMHGGYYSGSDTASNASDDNDTYDPDKSFASLSQPPRKNRRGQQERRKIAEKKFGSRAKHLVKANGAEGVHSARVGLINTDGRDGVRGSGWDTRRGAVGPGEAADRRRAKNGRVRDEKKGKREARPMNRYERRHGVAKSLDRLGKRGGGGGTLSGRGRGVGGMGRVESTGSNSLAITGNRPRNDLTEKKAGEGKTAASKEKLHPSWEAARKRKIESATVGASSFAGKKITFD